MMRRLLQILSLWTIGSLHSKQQRRPSFLCNAQLFVPGAIDATPALSTFAMALTTAGLRPLLNQIGPYTVFGPDDDALSTLDPKYLDPEWVAHLTEILLQHIVQQSPAYTTSIWAVGTQLSPLSGGSITLTSVDPSFQINNGVTIVTPDIAAQNGVIHVIDQVILPPSARDSIMDIIAIIPEFFSILNSLLVQSGLDATLRLDGPYTMFAPSNDAFERMDPDVLQSLQDNPTELRAVLEYHIVPGIYLVDTMQQPDIVTLTTLNGLSLPKPLQVIQFVDLLATNGAMHIVDNVLIPEEGATPAPDTPPPETPPPTPVAATPAPETIPPTQVATTVVPATPAPTNLQTQPQPATPAPVTTTVAPTAVAPPVEEPNVTEAPTGTTIVEIGLSANFTTMMEALNQTEWYAILNMESAGPYTIFAVPNDGFANMPAKFLQDPVTWSRHLTNVLTLHILDGVILETNLTVNASLATQNRNNNLTVTSEDPLQLNNVNVTETDIMASNGIVHVVEEVLLPPTALDTAMDVIRQFPDQFSTLESLLVAANLTSLFDGPGPLTAFAPVNAAFNALPAGTLDALAADPVALERTLLYHGTPVLADFASVLPNTEIIVPTFLEGANASLNRLPSPSVNDVNVLFLDLLVQNGLVQVIDMVLMPPDLVEATDAPEEQVPPGFYSDFFWADLPPNVQEAAAMLGYNETIWNNGLPVETSDLFWGQLTPEQQAAAAVLGYDQQSWDNPATEAPVDLTEAPVDVTEAPVDVTEFPVEVTDTPVDVTEAPIEQVPPEFYSDLVWADLPPNVQEAAAILGYNETTWNNGLPVETSELLWGQLTPEQQAAAAVLGFDQQSWDNPATEAPVDFTEAPVDLSPPPETNQSVTTVAPTVAPTSDILATPISTVSPTGAATTVPESTLSPTAPITTAAPTTAGVGIETLSPTVGATDGSGTVMDVVRSDPNLSTLNNLIVSAGLEEIFDSPGPLTVFAPNDIAFSMLPDSVIIAIETNMDILTSILLYHVIDTEGIYSIFLQDGAVYATVQGGSVVISQDGAAIMVNEASIITPDLVASNGVIHLIDMVLTPPIDGLPTVPTDAPTITDATTAAPTPTTSAVGDIPPGFYSNFIWVELPPEVQEAASVLGYNETSWDNGLPVETSGLFWDQLSPEQQAAAAALGYDQESWDNPVTDAPIDETEVPTEFTDVPAEATGVPVEATSSPSIAPSTQSPSTDPVFSTIAPTIPSVASTTPTETAPPVVTDTQPPLTPAPTASAIVTTLAPTSPDDCVTVPGQVVCCPPGETEGIYFFCRYI